MQLLDDLQRPSGREQVTNRFAWRVRSDDGAVQWAFVEERLGQVWITGYPAFPVDVLRPGPNPIAGIVAGAGAGALVGAAFGGPAGAAVGATLGALIGASGSNSSRS